MQSLAISNLNNAQAQWIRLEVTFQPTVNGILQGTQIVQPCTQNWTEIQFSICSSEIQPTETESCSCQTTAHTIKVILEIRMARFKIFLWFELSWPQPKAELWPWGSRAFRPCPLFKMLVLICYQTFLKSLMSMSQTTVESVQSFFAIGCGGMRKLRG